MKLNEIKWAFFGTTEFSTILLDELKVSGFLPSLIVTTEDSLQGRKMVLTAPPVKIWAEKEGISYIQPKTLKTEDAPLLIKSYSPKGFDVFVLFSYGKIIPQNILDIPVYGILNMHPSLLPRLRGPSPIKSAILSEEETGVTIIKLDALMDHGPIVAQKKIYMKEWPPYENDLENELAHQGGKLMVNVLPEWVLGKIQPKEQDHNKATFCKKIEKTDGEINLDDNSEMNLRKIRAYHIWPGAYFFYNNGDVKTRIIVKRAHIENNNLILDRVVPEGRKEMDYKDYLKGRK